MVESKRLRKCLGSTTTMARLRPRFLLGYTRAGDYPPPREHPLGGVNVRETWRVVSSTTPR